MPKKSQSYSLTSGKLAKKPQMSLIILSIYDDVDQYTQLEGVYIKWEKLLE